MLWYYELWCEKGFIRKSFLFDSRDKALADYEKAIDEEMRKEYEETGKRENGDYTYVLHCEK